MASSYVRKILGFIGIVDVKIVLAGGTLAVDMGQKSLDDFIAPIESGLSASMRACQRLTAGFTGIAAQNCVPSHRRGRLRFRARDYFSSR